MTPTRPTRSAAVTVVAVSLMASSPLAAQPTTEDVVGVIEEQVLAPAIESILGAIGLPGVVSEARNEGVADSTLAVVIEELRDRGVLAAEAEDVLAQEVEAVRSGGPIDNFGAFVQSQLAAGLRGRELAATIRAEHRAMGVGMPPQRPDRVRGMREGGGQGRGQRGGTGAGRRQLDDPADGRGRGESRRPGGPRGDAS